MSVSSRIILRVLVFIFATCHVRGLENAVVEVDEKGSFKFHMRGVNWKSGGDICSVKTPNKDQHFRLDPLRSDQAVDSRIKYSRANGSECGVFVTNADAWLDTGEWRLSITNSTGNIEQQFNVRVVVTTKNVVPKTPVSVMEGENLYLRFEERLLVNVVECRVNWTQREIILTPGSNVDRLVAYWGAGLNKECGVRAAHITTWDGGKWSLKARNRTGHMVQGVFQVTVLSRNYPVEQAKTFIDGEYQTLTMGVNSSSYCQVQRPSGDLEQLQQNKQCSVPLKKVTKAQEGTWTARYAVTGLITEIKTSVSVRVKKNNVIETLLKQSSRHPGGLDLLCRWTTYEFPNIQASFCRFVRPDGVAFSLRDGIGNTDYSYHGDGINLSRTVKDCGVTIHNPKKRDIGTWQCIIGINYQNLVTGGFIHVPSANLRNVSESQTSAAIRVSGGERETVVLQEEPLILSCEATAALKYCWFGHPDGCTLAVYETSMLSKASNKRAGYSYTGLGLELGDCTITVSSANLNDTGNWTCNMGVNGSTDLQILLSVRVTHDNIAAEVPEIVYLKKEPTIIKCHSVPRGVALEYCRFIRPDGVGLGFVTNSDVVLGRYRYFGDGLEKGDCGVKIEIVKDEDFGYWTCVALHTAQAVEGKARILLQGQQVVITGLSGGSIAGVVFFVVLVAMVISLCVFYLHKKFKMEA